MGTDSQRPLANNQQTRGEIAKAVAEVLVMDQRQPRTPEQQAIVTRARVTLNLK